MINLNQFQSYPCFTGIQKKQNPITQEPVLKQLNADTISFKGGTEYVSPAVMKLVNMAAKQTDKTFFRRLIKLCENPNNNEIEKEVKTYAEGLKGDYKKKAIEILNIIQNEQKTAKVLKDKIPGIRAKVGIASNKD